MMPVPVLWFIEKRETGKVHPAMLYCGLALLPDQAAQGLFGGSGWWYAANPGLTELLTG